VSLYTVGNVFILGLLAPPHVVGYYAGGEKIARALQGLLGPASQTLYPRLSYLVHRSREQATRLIRTGLGFMCALGLAVSAVAFFGAPFWVHLVLGSAFGPAIPVLRVLALVIPLVALSNVFGIQWMLPLGLDCSFNRIIIGAGFLNIALATALAPRFGALGMALAVLGTEACVTGAMYGYLRRHGLYPSLAPARDGG
jgi:PST family polysaccharide transporter